MSKVSICCYAGAHTQLSLRTALLTHCRLRWLHENQHLELRESTMVTALQSGFFHIAQYLYTQQCPWPTYLTSSDVYEKPIKACNLDMLRWLRERGCLMSTGIVCYTAASTGSLEVMRFLIEHGGELNALTMAAAAEHGFIELCQFLRAVQPTACPWDERAVMRAAEGGHTELLRWLLDNECPWNPERYYKQLLLVVDTH
jgi:hypothetical protein